MLLNAQSVTDAHELILLKRWKQSFSKPANFHKTVVLPHTQILVRSLYTSPGINISKENNFTHKKNKNKNNNKN